MKLDDVRFLGSWVYHLRPMVKHYQGSPDLLVDLIADSLFQTIKNCSENRLHREAEEEFWSLSKSPRIGEHHGRRGTG